MKRIGASGFPGSSCLRLTALWLLLNQTLAAGQILLGLVLALALAWSASALRPLQARLQRFDVAAPPGAGRHHGHRALERRRRAPGSRLWCHADDVRSGFLQIPLDLRDPHGLAALAVIVTSTPGTVWVGLSPDRRHADVCMCSTCKTKPS